MSPPKSTKKTHADYFVDWIIELDDPDPTSIGWARRRQITLTEIIDRAKWTRGQ